MGWQRKLQLGFSGLALIAVAIATQASYGQAQLASPTIQSAPTETTLDEAEAPSPAELLPGLWQVQLPDGPPVQMLFQADGTLLLFHPDPALKTALSATYRWPEGESARAIDLEASGDLNQGIIEFLGEDQLRLDSNPSGLPRPTKFGDQTLLFERINLNSVNLEAVRIVSFEEWMDSL